MMANQFYEEVNGKDLELNKFGLKRCLSLASVFRQL